MAYPIFGIFVEERIRHPGRVCKKVTQRYGFLIAASILELLELWKHLVRGRVEVELLFLD